MDTDSNQEVIRVRKNHEHSFWRQQGIEFLNQGSHLPLQIFNQVWESSHFDFALHELAQRHRWNADHGSFLLNRTDDAGSGVNNSVIAHRRVIGQTRLTADRDPIADR